MMKSVRVLYIAGWGRSGTTIIGNILNEVDGWFHVGELRDIWQHGLVANLPCGSGVPFRESEVWRAILEAAYGNAEVDGNELVRLQHGAPHNRHVLRAVWLQQGELELTTEQQQYVDYLKRLYLGIQQATGCRIIVDSSKFPSHLYLLSRIPELDLRVVHLVRDPRGVAYSWRRKKIEGHTISPAMSSLKWAMWNLILEGVGRLMPGRYLRVRYEDFAAAPRHAMQQMAAIAGEPDATLPFVTDRSVRLGPNHTVWGNPNRLQQGEIELRQDSEWRRKISPADSALVTTLTWPLLLRYGYVGQGSAPQQQAA